MSGWSPRSHGATDQHISSSSSLSIRKPKVPFSFYASSAILQTQSVFLISLFLFQAASVVSLNTDYVVLLRLRDCKATVVIKCMLHVKFFLK